uniref:Uncharacterized protein n=1 Tax=Fibrocapsa japonica TaxID=94617 RepID=A0A7S2XYH0_9STRA|mmetsp:Transcript_2957/g.4355  ORF Transcript_2957/g.4355 Transcript_2957/m.4355 type:complete len:251 (+) Transcript_2957:99-851(+)
MEEQPENQGQPVMLQVPVQAIETAIAEAATDEQWQNGLCQCAGGSFGTCFYGLFCPCCAIATARTYYDGSNWCFNCLVTPHLAARDIIREGYNIKGSWLSDIFLTIFCAGCSAVQLMNEVETRGLVSADFGTARPPDPQPWTKKGVCSNFGNFFFGMCCPHCAISQARSSFDGSEFCFNCCCVSPCLARSVIREGYNIEGNCFGDLIYPCCCPSCAACQMLNEVDERGKVNKRTVVMQQNLDAQVMNRVR